MTRRQWTAAAVMFCGIVVLIGNLWRLYAAGFTVWLGLNLFVAVGLLVTGWGQLAQLAKLPKPK